jgi:hypothetical protein
MFFMILMYIQFAKYLSNINNTEYFTSDNESDGIENATHNTFPKKRNILVSISSFFFGNVLWIAFSIPSASSLSLVKYPV